MKQYNIKNCCQAVIIILISFFCSFLFSADQTAKITVSRAYIKETHMSFSKTIAVLLIDNTVTLLEEKGSWYKIKTANGQEGWLMKSNLFKRKSFAGLSSLKGEVKSEIAMTSAAVSASEDESGGKFNNKILGLYLKANPDIKYNDFLDYFTNAKPKDVLGEYKQFREQGKLGEYQ